VENFAEAPGFLFLCTEAYPCPNRYSKMVPGVSLGRLYVLAKSPFRRDILQVTDGEPDGFRSNPGLQRFEGRTPTDGTQNQVAGQDSGIGGPKFVVHQSPEVAHTHLTILSWGGDSTIKP